MVREALSRHGASGNGQLLWCRCAARLFHGRGHIVIHLQDSQILDSYIHTYIHICIYIHYDSCLIGMLSFNWKPLENIYKSSTCTIGGQLPPEITLPDTPGILAFYFNAWYQTSTQIHARSKNVNLQRSNVSRLAGLQNLSSKSHCPRSPDHPSCILQHRMQTKCFKMPSVPTVLYIVCSNHLGGVL